MPDRRRGTTPPGSVVPPDLSSLLSIQLASGGGRAHAQETWYGLDTATSSVEDLSPSSTVDPPRRSTRERGRNELQCLVRQYGEIGGVFEATGREHDGVRRDTGYPTEVRSRDRGGCSGVALGPGNDRLGRDLPPGPRRVRHLVWLKARHSSKRLQGSGHVSRDSQRNRNGWTHVQERGHSPPAHRKWHYRSGDSVRWDKRGECGSGLRH